MKAWRSSIRGAIIMENNYNYSRYGINRHSMNQKVLEKYFFLRYHGSWRVCSRMWRVEKKKWSLLTRVSYFQALTSWSRVRLWNFMKRPGAKYVWFCEPHSLYRSWKQLQLTFSCKWEHSCLPVKLSFEIPKKIFIKCSCVTKYYNCYQSLKT